MIVTDRVELDDQIAKTFETVGAVSEAEGDECHASSGAHLRELLQGNHRYVFTLIHKFQTSRRCSATAPTSSCITDEAHRSQYDTLALNMRAALPNALFIGFTGTPLIAGEERDPARSSATTSPSTTSSSRSRTAPPSRCTTRTACPSCSSSTRT